MMSVIIFPEVVLTVSDFSLGINNPLGAIPQLLNATKRGPIIGACCSDRELHCRGMSWKSFRYRHD